MVEAISIVILVLAFFGLLTFHFRRKVEVQEERNGKYKGTGGKGGPDNRLDTDTSG